MSRTSGESACPPDRVNCRVDKCISFKEGAYSFAWLMSDLCLKNEAYTVCRMLVFSRDLKSDLCLKNEACTGCRALVCSHGLCRIFA